MRTRFHASALGFLALLLMVTLASPAVSIGSSVEAPVAEAAMVGDTETVRTLLRQGADVNAAQGDGMTALHWAAQNGDTATLQVLMYAGAAVEPTTRLGGYTPLHLASKAGRAETVSMLLEAGSSGDRATDTGVTSMHLAAEAGDSAAITALVANGADIDARDTGAERTPLMYAAAFNRLDAMRTLIDAGADVTLETRVLDWLSMSREDSAEQQVRRRVQQASRPPQRGGNQSAAERAAAARAGGQTQQQQGQQAQQAAQSGQTPPDPDTPPTSGQASQTTTPPDPDTPPTSGQASQTTTPPDPDDPPARAARGGQTPPDPDDPPAEEPARPAVDPNAPRSMSNQEQIGKQGGFTALHYAARDGRFDAAMMLIEAGTEIDHRTGGDDSTAMVVAAVNGNFDLAAKLLEMGADPNAVSEDGVGALFAAINNEWQLRTWYPQPTASQQQKTTYLDLMRAVLEAGADPNQRVTQHVWYAAYNAGRMGVDFTGATAFWRAAYGLDVKAMRLLVEYGADPNLSTFVLASNRSRFGRSTSDDDDPSGMDPIPPGGPNVHPLHAATGVGFGTSRVGQQHRHVPGGWLPAVEYLVGELGVDVNVRDNSGYSAVHNAASRGDNETIEYLVEHGADVTFVSRRGQTTVDMANGPQQRVQPFPETIALLEGLGAENNHNCISCD